MTHTCHWEPMLNSLHTHILFYFQKIIDILKMDVESAEWPSFEAMFEENSLRNVKQLSFEIHLEEDFKRYFDILLYIEKLGFRKYLMNKNRRCKRCFEIYYINMIFL